MSDDYRRGYEAGYMARQAELELQAEKVLNSLSLESRVSVSDAVGIQVAMEVLADTPDTPDTGDYTHWGKMVGLCGMLLAFLSLVFLLLSWGLIG